MLMPTVQGGTAEEGKENMKRIEIVISEISNDEKSEVIEETRVIFLRAYKIEELMDDQGLLGDLLRKPLVEKWNLVM